MDFFAVATVGFYPTPTTSAEHRMAYASSWGLLGAAPAIGAAALLAGIYPNFFSGKWPK